MHVVIPRIHLIRARAASIVAMLLPLGLHAHPGVPADPATIAKVREKVAALFPASTPIATGDNVSIPAADLRLAVVRSYLNRGIYFEGGPRDVNHAPAELELRALLYLVNTQVLAARATATDQERARARFAEHTRSHRDTASAANAYLAALGVSKADWDRHDFAQHLAELVLKREVEATVTEQEIRRHYGENPARFAIPEALHTPQLFFPRYDAQTGQPFAGPAKLARDARIAAALHRARAGDDFAALARDSTSSSSAAVANRNREYVYQRGQMSPAFDVAAFALSPGEAACIETSDGTYLLRPTKKLPARQQALPEVRLDIIEALGVQRMSGHLEQLQRSANLHIHDARLSALHAARLTGAAPTTPDIPASRLN